MKRSLAAVAALFLVSIVAPSARAWDAPELKARVNDTAELLSPAERLQLEQKLQAFETLTGHQFAFLSVQTLGGVPVEEFGIKTATAWRLGDKNRDDGLLFLVSKGDRKIRIEVGYGLEGVLPDAVASRVIRETIGPAFKRGDWVGGVNAGFDALIAAAQPAAAESQSDPAPVQTAVVVAPKKPASDGRVIAFLFGILGFGAIAAFFAALIRNGRREAQLDQEHQERVREWERQRFRSDTPLAAAVEPIYAPQRFTAPSYIPIPVPVPIVTPEPPAPTYSSRSDDDDDRRRSSSSRDDSSSNIDIGGLFGGGSDSGGGFDGGGGGFGGGGASGDF